MTRNKLYAILSTACAAGFTWLIVNYYRHAAHPDEQGICLFKRLTTIPCPSCGSTRSVLAFMHRDFAGALYWNPFGLLIILVLLVVPIWIIHDLVRQKEGLLIVYLKAENLFKRKWVAIPAVIIVIANWLWNIYKGL